MYKFTLQEYATKHPEILPVVPHPVQVMDALSKYEGYKPLKQARGGSWYWVFTEREIKQYLYDILTEATYVVDEEVLPY